MLKGVASSGGMTVGNTVTSGTANTILYVDGSGNLASSVSPGFSYSVSAKRATLNANTAAPITATGVLQVVGADNSSSQIVIDDFGASPGNIMFRTARGTLAAPTNLTLNFLAGSIQLNGYGATGYSTNRASVNFYASEAWTDSAQGTYVTINATPTGSTTPAEGLRVSSTLLTLAGNISVPGNADITAASASLYIRGGGTSLILSNAGDSGSWQLLTGGNFNPITNNTGSIGSATVAVANGYFTTLYSGAPTTGVTYSRLAIKHATTSVTAAVGATVTATNLIPAKANVLGVNTVVTTALGNSTGTTGYTVGDGTDPDRWGSVTGITAGTDTDGNDATANPTGWFTAANNVVLTALGGNFDGTGVVYIDVAYTLTEAD